MCEECELQQADDEADAARELDAQRQNHLEGQQLKALCVGIYSA